MDLKLYFIVGSESCAYSQPVIVVNCVESGKSIFTSGTIFQVDARFIKASKI